MKSLMRLSLSQQMSTCLFRSSLKFFCICILLLLGLTQPKYTHAQETAVSLKNITSKTLGTYKKPQLIDGAQAKEKLRQLRAGIEALIHMSEMISEAHARKAMQAQIDSLKATLNQLETLIKNAAIVDYSFPTPLPRLNEAQAEKRTSRKTRTSRDSRTLGVSDHGRSSSTPQSQQNPTGIRAMSATQTSRLWGAIERASFRNDKMGVIHKIAREHYLNTQQAELFVESLTFSKDRRDAIKLLYPRLVDPSQVDVLYHLLDQPAHRREVKQVIEQVNMNRRLQRAQ